MADMSTSGTPPPLIDLTQLVTAVRRRPRFWGGLGLVGLLIGLVLAVAIPRSPTATAEVLIARPAGQQAGASTDTAVAVLQGTHIAEAALQDVHGTGSAERFAKSYKAVGVTNDVVKVTAEGSSRSDALAKTKAVSDAFIADHVSRAKAAAKAQAKAAATQGQQSQATDAKANAAVAADTRIIDGPRMAPYSLPLTVLRDAGIGLAAGLVIGLLLAALSAVMWERPVLRRDVGEHLGASVVAQVPGRRWITTLPWRRVAEVDEHKRVAATLARILGRERPGASLLELGASRTTAAVATGIAEELASVGRGTVMVDALSAQELLYARGGPPAGVRMLDVGEAGTRPGNPGQFVLGLGSVAPGAAWTDLATLGPETVLVVRAGYAETAWLHNVARQLANEGVAILGVVLVDPDPKDRTDGTLWDALHTALRGRGMSASPTAAPSAVDGNGHPANRTGYLPAVFTPGRHGSRGEEWNS
jgi:capsular polysaccharide biosynthesis protein